VSKVILKGNRSFYNLPFFREESVCKRNMDKSIAQQDIMFVMTESQRCPNTCDPCLDVLELEEGDERLKLDLERYRSLTHPLKSDKVFTHRPAGNAACCEIKVCIKLRPLFITF